MQFHLATTRKTVTGDITQFVWLMSMVHLGRMVMDSDTEVDVNALSSHTAHDLIEAGWFSVEEWHEALAAFEAESLDQELKDLLS